MIRFTYFILFLFLVASCQPKADTNNKKQLTVSIAPQKSLVAMIAGENYEVQTMLPTGSNHETYEPTPRDMEKISKSFFYFTLGALDFELTWMDRFKKSNPEMLVINTNTGIEMLDGHICNHDDHQHAEHSHGVDPHIWLSPACMKIQALNIYKALSSVDKADTAIFRVNFEKFNTLADSVDRIIRNILTGSEGKAFLIFHPALGYFARDYNLLQISIEQDGKEPSPAHLEQLIKSAKEKNIKSVFISEEFDTRHAKAVAQEINAKIITFDAMSENWAENMVHLARLISEN